MTKHLLLVTTLLFSTIIFAQQQDGYWDKERSTTKEIKVSARDRIIIKTEDLPIGTTEIVYRITLLDENQQLASSLVSVLKSIPDPTGISQGSAGAVFVLSKISGDDKCTYAVFSKEDLATKYKDSGKTLESCVIQDTPVSKDAKRLSVDKISCFSSNTTALWFGFESKNWIMNQKIILEVVPWVDKKLSRGWTVENRKSIIDQCKTSNLAQKMSNSDSFCVCILDKVQAKYKFKEFQNLLPMERSKVFKDAGDICLNETNASPAITADLRKEAAVLIKNGKYGAAIEKLSVIINNGKATVMDYNNIGSCYLLTKQYGKALKYLQDGEKLDNTELLIQLNLAHAYLLNDNYKEAKKIYNKYKNQNVTDSVSWVQKTEQDFKSFDKNGIQNEDFERVLKLYKE
ncbi:tetratricopeptide repeat protein [Flavobacterium sp.]|uniref:tetratricopeptide repeat protein n=1 Tax=Flavobacterium sp. TaxID=239 RepID=UPI002B8EE268|nr:tetratricopeptide repeat protein [Flavobacterium sp.]HSD05669.1 tetratricopeptide repeat protein [Flavobacterium sp.]